MDKEKLDALLTSGAITQEEYEVLTAGATSEEEPPTDAPEKRIQQQVEKLTAKLGKEKVALQQQVERLKKEKLTDGERHELEQQEREAALAERERALLEKENRLYAIRAIKAAGLDDGGDTSLELVDFVLASDEKAIDSKVKAFGSLISKLVKAEVDRTFKAGGREPQRGGSGGVERNPYSKAAFNLTEQMKLESENPKEAARLKTAAQ